MKKIIIIIICLVCIGEIYSQSCTTNNSNCENGNGINTNPSNPTNPNCTNMRNNFDWRVQRTDFLPEDYIVYGPGTTYKEIQNPFTGPSGATHAGTVTNQRASNYQPEDGWELLKVEFGIQGNANINNDPNFQPNQPTNYTKPKLPYMILYNKYSGTMRFFGSLLDANSDYETLEVILTIPSKDAKYLPNNSSTDPFDYNENLKATNLLSIQGESVQPLDQETDEASISVFIKFRNNEAEFFWFDLPVAYDPCICNNNVQLDIAFRFTQTAQIALNQVVDNGIKNINKPSSSGNADYARMVVGRILAAGVSGALAIKTGGAIVNYKAFIDLVDVVKDHPSRANNQTEKDNLNKLKNYLTCAEKMFSVVNGSFKDVTTTSTLKADLTKQIAAGQKILDANTTFLSSLVKGCSTGDNAATASTKALEFSGTFTRSPMIGGSEIFLAMPGSNWGNTNLLPKDYISNNTIIPSYPTYNERLGVLSFLETPELEVHIKRTECSTYVVDKFFYFTGISFTFKQSKSFKYTFNPKVNLNLNKSKIQVRLVVKMPIRYGPPYNSSLKDNSICRIDNSIITPINFYSESNSMYNFNTPYVDIDDFANLPLRFDITKLGLPFLQFNEDSLMKYAFFQIKVIGVSNDIGTDNKNNTFYLNHTYPVKIKTLNSDPYSSIDNKLLPNFKKGIKEFDTDVQFNINEDLFFEGPVFISAQMSTSNGAKIKIYSMNGFELMPGAKISPDIELIVGFPWDKVPQPPQTYAQVSAFCGNNNKYKAQTFSQSAIKREKEEYEARQIREEEAIKQKSIIAFKLAPNPTTGNFTVSIFNNNEQDYSIALMDVTGKVLLNNLYNGKQTSQLIETNGLAAGIYFVKITCGNTQKTEKLIIQSNY